jgi:hypothetical protein
VVGDVLEGLLEIVGLGVGGETFEYAAGSAGL